ncbi:MAG: hypothetical protein A2Z70_01320 [Chloroflexi bacterium RBG_13_48_17]|nr:MAG: hypothetical protein A2Z70_01320 [Chloroflexi bacterium RBG_13_48_17]
MLGFGKRTRSISDIDGLKSSLPKVSGKARCLVVFEDSATYGYRYLDNNLIPKGSIPILDGEPTHFLNLAGNTLSCINYTNTPIPVKGDNNDNEENTPQACFESQFWEELETILSLMANWVERVKLGIFIAFCIAALVILFLVGSMAMGD